MKFKNYLVYAPLIGLNFDVIHDYKSSNIEFSIYESNDKRDVLIENQIEKTTKYVLEYLKRNQVLYDKDCRVEHLNIYITNELDINNKERFGFLQQPDEYGVIREVYGIYDPTPGDPINSVMIISNKNDTKLFLSIINHEIAHYWYDRMCLENRQFISSEEFAKHIEEYYGD